MITKDCTQQTWKIEAKLFKMHDVPPLNVWQWPGVATNDLCNQQRLDINPLKES